MLVNMTLASKSTFKNMRQRLTKINLILNFSAVPHCFHFTFSLSIHGYILSYLAKLSIIITIKLLIHPFRGPVDICIFTMYSYVRSLNKVRMYKKKSVVNV